MPGESELHEGSEASAPIHKDNATKKQAVKRTIVGATCKLGEVWLQAVSIPQRRKVGSNLEPYIFAIRKHIKLVERFSSALWADLEVGL